MLRDRFPKKNKVLIELIDDVTAKMTTVEPDSPEYKKLLKNLERLTALKTKSRKWHVNPDVLIPAIASVLGILVIVAYEQKHVMSSKGLNFVPKPTSQMH